MNARGFTVIEVLVVLVIVGVVFGLTLQSLSETRHLTRTSDQLADELMVATRIMSLLDQCVPLMNPRDDQRLCRADALHFVYTQNDKDVQVNISRDGDTVVLKLSGRPDLRMPGQMAFRYLDQEWTDSLDSTIVPRAVAVLIRPEPVTENEPYEMVINVPAGNFRVSAFSSGSESSDNEEQLGNLVTSEVSHEF